MFIQQLQETLQYQDALRCHLQINFTYYKPCTTGSCVTMHIDNYQCLIYFQKLFLCSRRVLICKNSSLCHLYWYLESTHPVTIQLPKRSHLSTHLQSSEFYTSGLSFQLSVSLAFNILKSLFKYKVAYNHTVLLIISYNILQLN